MERRFGILLNDYKDNYIQYKSNGNQRYKSAYESAQTAIEDLFSNMNSLPSKTEDTTELEMKLIHENDNAVGSEMRVPSSSFINQYSHTVQYIAIGSLGAVTLILVLKPWSFFA